jgi:hypothetical protein
VPRDLLIDRLNKNINNLIKEYSNLQSQSHRVEISDPFRSSGKSGAASPFIKTLFPEIKAAATLERSLNTALGWGWDKVVALIAQATYGNGSYGHRVHGQIPAVSSSTIELIVNAYRDIPRREPDTIVELEKIRSSVTLSGAKEDVSEKDDAYYVDHDGVEHHIEIKTPKPNYDQMKAAKRRILRIHAVRHPTSVKAFVGMPYNPNGRYGVYGWPTTRIYLDSSEDLLVGEEFWNYVGNSMDTYSELLDCFYEVGRDRKMELAKLLIG